MLFFKGAWERKHCKELDLILNNAYRDDIIMSCVEPAGEIISSVLRSIITSL